MRIMVKVRQTCPTIFKSILSSMAVVLRSDIVCRTGVSCYIRRGQTQTTNPASEWMETAARASSAATTTPPGGRLPSAMITPSQGWTSMVTKF